MDCLRWVSAELSVVINKCTERMSRYPHLRDETEQFVKRSLSDREIMTEEQIKLVIEIELAYINTNHEDFIGLHLNGAGAPNSNLGGQNGTDGTVGSNLPQGNRLGNQVIRKGHMTVVNVGLVKGTKGWFVLTTDR